jgi:hypothetical protein
MKCRFWKGHDWEELEEVYHGSNPPMRYVKKICLVCKTWVDEITPLHRRLEKERFNKMSRADRAKALWMDRYNPND